MSDRLERLQRTREREANRKTIGPLAKTFTIDIVGITFQPGYPGNLYELETLNFDAEAMGERVPVILVREPDNEFDPNCIAVHCPALGEIGLLGKVPRALAAKLAPSLDAGEIWQGEVSHIRFDHDHPEHPGITIQATRRTP